MCLWLRQLYEFNAHYNLTINISEDDNPSVMIYRYSYSLSDEVDRGIREDDRIKIWVVEGTNIDRSCRCFGRDRRSCAVDRRSLFL